MKAVIDTNVLLVANGQHLEASPTCMIACIEHLKAMKQSGTVVIDDGYRILGEYRHKTHPNQPKGTGDIFLKWLLQNQGNIQRVQQVTLHETEENRFAEFPDAALENLFDPPDRKFAATANAHPDKPPIWQAADCKWLDWWPTLEARGIEVKFLCPDDVCTSYRKKFPRLPPPTLPPKAA